MTWIRHSAARSGRWAGLVAVYLSRSARISPYQVVLDSAGLASTSSRRFVAGHCRCFSRPVLVPPLTHVLSSGHGISNHVSTSSSKGVPRDVARAAGTASVGPELCNGEAGQEYGSAGDKEQVRAASWKGLAQSLPGRTEKDAQRGVGEGRVMGTKVVLSDSWSRSLVVDGGGEGLPLLAKACKMGTTAAAWRLTMARNMLVRAGGKDDEQGDGSRKGKEEEGGERGGEGAVGTAAEGVERMPSSPVGDTRGDAATGGAFSQSSSATAAAGGDDHPVSGENSTVATAEVDGEAGGTESTPVVLEPAENLWSGLQEVYESVRVWVALGFHRAAVERNFDLMNFLEGVRHAYLMVNDLFAKLDFKTMKQMVAPRVLRAFEETVDYYKKKGLRMEHIVDSVNDIRLVKIWFIPDGADALELKDMAPVIDGYGNNWLVFAVRLRTQDRCRLFNVETGRLVSHTVDRRGHVWLFARQLPDKSRLPVEDLESSWYLVDFKFPG
ncbi:hypothetical protein CBR_g6573 [Chara braunii]|uniref:Tim44-like domain-containing protein n=1 Tax=Chara braunii TaxID=69332 RepID=A0A388KK55_CHABU|nr:hypothetical protein CBR_g6573 [Chara braunii]|eukprot:GBG70445.1 hypothetical protein CBR_g6573 [Chara braunii]